MAKKRQRLFTLKVGQDIILTATRGGGPGGQHQNKVATAIRLSHPASGVELKVSTHKSQHRNKRDALRRLVDHPKFKSWLRLEAAARLQGYRDAEAKINEFMEPKNLRVEVGDGKTWRPE